MQIPDAVIIPPKVCHTHICLEHKSSAVAIKTFVNWETSLSPQPVWCEI